MNKKALLFLLLFLVLSTAAFASCENPGAPPGAAASVTSSQASDVQTMTENLKDSYSEDIDTATETIMDGGDEGGGEEGGEEESPPNNLQAMEDSILAKLNEFWTNWNEALHQMTKQLHAGTIDSTRQFASSYDASDITSTALEIQKKEVETKKRYQPTEQACQFDTTARYAAYSGRVAGAVTTGYALDFNEIGTNKKATPAAEGKAGLQRARWEVYQSKFCDGDANNRAAGCTAGSANPKANMHVLPSKTIFARETIDLSDADTRDAVTQLMFNITGYRAPELIPVTALKSAVGLQQRQENREYAAQMDAVGALAYSVVADRAPGLPAPEVQAQRIKHGVSTASPKPSKREIRESIVEGMWDPNYYIELFDSPGTIAQKELYLKAYNLLLLYEMIGKQEKISNVYAIETANILNKTDSSRHNASASAPLK